MDSTDNLDINLFFRLIDLSNLGHDLLILANYCSLIVLLSDIFRIFATAIRKERKDILLNRLSIATREETSKTFNIGTAPSGRRLPIFESGLWRAESRMANVCASY